MNEEYRDAEEVLMVIKKATFPVEKMNQYRRAYQFMQ